MKKVALITGASGGLGSAIAKEMSKKGIHVFLTGQNEKKLFSVSKSIGDTCIGFESVDLKNVKDIVKICNKVKPDILVNSAGVFPVKSIEDTTYQEYNDCFDINVRAPFFMTKECIQHMKQRKWGRIINIGSSSAYAGFANTSVYCSSKHALLGMTRSMFNELKNENIRAYCISPGSIKTEMGKNVIGQDFNTFMDPEEISKFILEIIEYNGNMICEEVRLNRMFVQ